MIKDKDSSIKELADSYGIVYFKVIIAGGRDFNNWSLLSNTMDGLLSKKYDEQETVQIVSGMAKGADLLGVRYAEDTDLEVLSYPADWNKHGKAAGPIRNTEMSKVADALVAFWDGKSRGTKHMIDTMVKLGKPVRIIRYKPKSTNRYLA